VTFADQTEIREKIRAAFPALRFLGTISNCPCDECEELRIELRGKAWDEVPTSFIDWTCSPTLLTPEAFCAFLPAYMLRGLDDPTAKRPVADFTLYCLVPTSDAGAERAPQRAALMTQDQRKAVRAYIEYLRDNGGCAGSFEQEIQQALDSLWR
jgi:hypothetical protein